MRVYNSFITTLALAFHRHSLRQRGYRVLRVELGLGQRQSTSHTRRVVFSGAGFHHLSSQSRDDGSGAKPTPVTKSLGSWN